VSDGKTVIDWPDGLLPAESAWHAVNELQIDAPPENVFAWLRRPDLWPSYYWNARFVRHLEGPWPEVELGSRFRWFTFGVVIHSEIVEFEEPGKGSEGRLAWSASALGAHGHHAWRIGARDGGTFVRTEETQRGWAATLSAPAMSRLQVRIHQHWLEGLAKVAAQGSPPLQ
jgi:uncharacterized protein YndB with AHSA1/START domain